MPDRYSQPTPDANRVREDIAQYVRDQAEHNRRQVELNRRRAELAYLAKTTKGVSATATAKTFGITRKRLYEWAAQHQASMKTNSSVRDTAP